jgi:hypothetical protein
LLAASGYSYHGPLGRLGFAPKISPESFQCAFTTAAGWGSYQQLRDASSQTCRIDLRYGQVRLSRLSFETVTPPTSVTVTIAGQPVAVGQTTITGTRVDITLSASITVASGQRLEVKLA